jgi:hypothetical protein
MELTRFLTELSVIDYFFVDKHANSIALAALLNAMEITRGFPLATKAEFRKQLTLLDNVDPSGAEVEECRSRLKALYAQGGYSAPSPSSVAAAPLQEEQSRAEVNSPVCVATDVYVPAQQLAGQCQADADYGTNYAVGTQDAEL